jgi:hypothetical protein
MSDRPASALVTIHIDLPGRDDEVDGESFRAEPLGDDLYRLDTIPFYAYDVHYQDVVRAVTQADGAPPTVLEVTQPSGHKTLRVLFDGELEADDIQRLLDGLTGRGVQFAHVHGSFYALNVPPDADYQGICTLLWNQENAGWLTYETGTTPPV